MFPPGAYQDNIFAGITQDTNDYNAVLEVHDYAPFCDPSLFARSETNLAMSHTLGQTLSEWGCACVTAIPNPQVWHDASTNLIYLVEDAAAPCSTSVQGPPGMYLPSTEVMSSKDKGTCSELGFPGKCASLAGLR